MTNDRARGNDGDAWDSARGMETVRSFRARATRGTDATSKRGGRTLRTRDSRRPRSPDAVARASFGEAEIALLKEKLSIVVGAFQSERGRRERELEALGSAASVELCEREYALSAVRGARGETVGKILEAREERARDDLDEALTGNEVLKAQLMDEHERAEMMGRETGQLRAAAARSAAAAFESARRGRGGTRGDEDDDRGGGRGDACEARGDERAIGAIGGKNRRFERGEYRVEQEVASTSRGKIRIATRWRNVTAHKTFEVAARGLESTSVRES